MSQKDPRKVFARMIAARLNKEGHSLSHMKTLEMVAAMFDTPNWTALKAQPGKPPMSPPKAAAALSRKMQHYGVPRQLAERLAQELDDDMLTLLKPTPTNRQALGAEDLNEFAEVLKTELLQRVGNPDPQAAFIETLKVLEGTYPLTVQQFRANVPVLNAAMQFSIGNEFEGVEAFLLKALYEEVNGPRLIAPEEYDSALLKEYDPALLNQPRFKLSDEPPMTFIPSEQEKMWFDTSPEAVLKRTMMREGRT